MNKDQNVLFAIHKKFSEMAAVFRERVCEDCNWSTPTFYRKMRAHALHPPTEKNKQSTYINSAERQRIIEIMDEVYEKLWRSMGKHRK